MLSKAVRRLRAAMVFLIANLEPTSKVTCTCMFLVALSTFGWSGTKSCFGRNHLLLFANSIQRSGKNKPAVVLGVIKNALHYFKSSFKKLNTLCAQLPYLLNAAVCLRIYTYNGPKMKYCKSQCVERIERNPTFQL